MINNRIYDKFQDGERVCGIFQIESTLLQSGTRSETILVAHEGNRIDLYLMDFYGEYKNYEDAQKDLGDGLKFIGKEYSNPVKDIGYKIAVPATGEEVSFEIYVMDSSAIHYLMHNNREL